MLHTCFMFRVLQFNTLCGVFNSLYPTQRRRVQAGLRLLPSDHPKAFFYTTPYPQSVDHRMPLSCTRYFLLVIPPYLNPGTPHDPHVRFLSDPVTCLAEFSTTAHYLQVQAFCMFYTSFLAYTPITLKLLRQHPGNLDMNNKNEN